MGAPGFLRRAIDSSIAAVEGLGETLSFAFALLGALLTGPRYGAETLRLMELLIRRCLVPVSLAVAPVGAVIAIQGIEIFRLFGAERMLSSFLGMAIVREYSPALASVMVAAQAGSSIAARIGTMRVRGQIDALAVMSVDPLRYVVVPGFIACLLVTPLLSVMTDFLGIAAGWLFAVGVGGLDHGAFMEHLTLQLQPSDLWVGMLKCGIFGAGIAFMAGYRGLQVRGGAAEVGQAANDTVVRTIILILVTDYLMGLLLLRWGI